MRSKALLSIILSAAMILNPASPVFAAGQMSSDEVSVSTETSAPEFQDEIVIEDDNTENSEQESVDDQETDEKGEEGTKPESEEAGMGERVLMKKANPKQIQQTLLKRKKRNRRIWLEPRVSVFRLVTM